MDRRSLLVLLPALGGLLLWSLLRTAGGPVDAGPPPDAGGLPLSCVSPSATSPGGTDVIDDGANGRGTVTINDRGACQRTYALTTTATSITLTAKAWW